MRARTMLRRRRQVNAKAGGATPTGASMLLRKIVSGLQSLVTAFGSAFGLTGQESGWLAMACRLLSCLPATSCRVRGDKMQAGLLRPRCVRGFTLVEVMTALAIVVVLVGMTLGALSQLRSQASRRAFTTDLAADLALARNRAIARQRTQVIVIDAAAGTNTLFGYFHLEDTGNRIYSTADRTALLVGLDPSTPSTAPSPYTVQALESSTQSSSPFYLSTTAWGGALPFPFAAVPQDTSGGCSFCTNGVGAVAFLPNGKAVFSDGNAAGGPRAAQGRGGTGAAAMSA